LGNHDPQHHARSKPGGQLRTLHLERDQTIVLEIADEIDRRHPAAPQLALYSVALAQGFGKSRIDSSHGDVPGVGNT
jgi:hypothetical protein